MEKGSEGVGTEGTGGGGGHGGVVHVSRRQAGGIGTGGLYFLVAVSCLVVVVAAIWLIHRGVKLCQKMLRKRSLRRVGCFPVEASSGGGAVCQDGPIRNGEIRIDMESCPLEAEVGGSRKKADYTAITIFDDEEDYVAVPQNSEVRIEIGEEQEEEKQEDENEEISIVICGKEKLPVGSRDDQLKGICPAEPEVSNAAIETVHGIMKSVSVEQVMFPKRTLYVIEEEDEYESGNEIDEQENRQSMAVEMVTQSGSDQEDENQNQGHGEMESSVGGTTGFTTHQRTDPAQMIPCNTITYITDDEEESENMGRILGYDSSDGASTVRQSSLAHESDTDQEIDQEDTIGSGRIEVRALYLPGTVGTIPSTTIVYSDMDYTSDDSADEGSMAPPSSEYWDSDPDSSDESVDEFQGLEELFQEIERPSQTANHELSEDTDTESDDEDLVLVEDLEPAKANFVAVYGNGDQDEVSKCTSFSAINNNPGSFFDDNENASTLIYALTTDEITPAGNPTASAPGQDALSGRSHLPLDTPEIPPQASDVNLSDSSGPPNIRQTFAAAGVPIPIEVNINLNVMRYCEHVPSNNCNVRGQTNMDASCSCGAQEPSPCSMEPDPAGTPELQQTPDTVEPRACPCPPTGGLVVCGEENPDTRVHGIRSMLDFMQAEGSPCHDHEDESGGGMDIMGIGARLSGWWDSAVRALTPVDDENESSYADTIGGLMTQKQDQNTCSEKKQEKTKRKDDDKPGRSEGQDADIETAESSGRGQEDLKDRVDPRARPSKRSTMEDYSLEDLLKMNEEIKKRK